MVSEITVIGGVHQTEDSSARHFSGLKRLYCQVRLWTRAARKYEAENIFRLLRPALPQCRSPRLARDRTVCFTRSAPTAKPYQFCDTTNEGA
jgi:hypothetical protein